MPFVRYLVLGRYITRPAGTEMQGVRPAPFAGPVGFRLLKLFHLSFGLRHLAGAPGTTFPVAKSVTQRRACLEERLTTTARSVTLTTAQTVAPPPSTSRR
jgi:hypothetical protein